MSETVKNALKGKLIIKGSLQLVTGMHIGASNDYAPIGSVDSPFIRNMMTQEPMIPGSSIKGKIRTLLARYESDTFILHPIDEDSDVLKRLFGASNPVMTARLQFSDIFLSEESRQVLQNLETDTYMGEVKFENTINRVSSVANPRQIERVPAGTKFDFELFYTVVDPEEVKEDMAALAQGLELLSLDYLGGHGTRGYGRVRFSDVKVTKFGHVSDDILKNSETALAQFVG